MECQKATAAAMHAKALDAQLTASTAALQDAQRAQFELQQQVRSLCCAVYGVVNILLMATHDSGVPLAGMQHVDHACMVGVLATTGNEITMSMPPCGQQWLLTLVAVCAGATTQVKQLQHSDRDGAELDKQEQLQELVSMVGWPASRSSHMQCQSMQRAGSRGYTCATELGYSTQGQHRPSPHPGHGPAFMTCCHCC